MSRALLFYDAGLELPAAVVAANLARALAEASGASVLLVDGPTSGAGLFTIEGRVPALRRLVAAPGQAEALAASLVGSRGVVAVDGTLDDRGVDAGQVEPVLAALARPFAHAILCVPVGAAAPPATHVLGVSHTPMRDDLRRALSAALERAGLPPGSARVFGLDAEPEPTRAEAASLRARHGGHATFSARGWEDAEPFPWLGARHRARAPIQRAAREIAGRRVGLALGSGGPRGFAHIGVIEALADLGVPFDAIVGSSAGAGIGGAWALGFDAAHIHRHFASTARLAARPAPSRRALFDGEALHRHLERGVDGLGFPDLRIPFGPVAADLSTFAGELFTDGPPMARAVQASCSVPGIHPPVEIAGRFYVDGGLVAPVPVAAARRLADIVVAVDLGMRVEGPRSAPGGLFGTIARALEMVLVGPHAAHAATADLHLRPLAGAPRLGGYGQCGPYRERGRRAVGDALPRLRALMPWLEPSDPAPESLSVIAARGRASSRRSS